MKSTSEVKTDDGHSVVNGSAQKYSGESTTQNGHVSAKQNGHVPDLQNGHVPDLQNGHVPDLQNGHVAETQNGYVAETQNDYVGSSASDSQHDTAQLLVKRRKVGNRVQDAERVRTKNEIINLSPGLPGFSANIIGFLMLLWPPVCVAFFWHACHAYQCSLGDLGGQVLHEISAWTIIVFARRNIPEVSAGSIMLYSAWMLLQVFLFLVLPGRIRRGTATPAGNVLTYNCNGFSAWIVSHVLFFILVKMGLIQATIISDNWGALMVISNVFGFSLALFSYVKAHYFPSHPEDRCFSGSCFYDFFMGIEHNPRIGPFDFKLFFNGRPGIVAWTLINLSFAAKQYKDFGYVSNTMILVNLLHATYVVDFFLNESWYLRTIDIAHDHFGFYLAWGDTVWLPFMYTLQSVYLARNPVNLPWWGCAAILLMGLTGYLIFRSVNHQKDYFRVEMKTNGKCTIWGKPARYILAPYATTDSKQQVSFLLASGWWGLSRHFNYVGDLLNALSYCLACGFGHVLPYFYIVFMLCLLIHRSYRDDVRCRQKYGVHWEKYCEIVPYRIIPYVF